jgi:hypothetical protein
MTPVAVFVASATAFISIVLILPVLARVSRRRSQAQDTAAITQHHIQPVQTQTLPPIRSWAEIAARTGPKTLDDWLAETEPNLRARTIELQLELVTITRKASVGAQLSQEALARYMRYPSFAALTADLLIDAAEHTGTPTSTMCDSAVAWPQEWEDELTALLDEKVPA